MNQAKIHIVSVRAYVIILAALMAFLILTIVLAFFDIDAWSRSHHLGGGWNTAIALTIAVIKAMLIALMFMHLKFSPRLTWIFASAGVVWLGIMLTLTMTDYLTRNSAIAPSPRGEPRYLKSNQFERNPTRPADSDFPDNPGHYH